MNYEYKELISRYNCHIILTFLFNCPAHLDCTSLGGDYWWKLMKFHNRRNLWSCLCSSCLEAVTLGGLNWFPLACFISEIESL